MRAPAKRSGSVAVHVEAAKRLLSELEQHAATAMNALGRENGQEFFAAVDERDRILGQLDEVVESIAHARASAGPASLNDPETGALMNDVARAAASALESHEELLRRTRQERDRLGAAIKRTNRIDPIASQYAAASKPNRSRSFSATG
jgi:hypothetical protein